MGIFHSNVNVYQSWTSRIAFWNDAEKRQSDSWNPLELDQIIGMMGISDKIWQSDDVVNRIRKTLRFFIMGGRNM